MMKNEEKEKKNSPIGFGSKEEKNRQGEIQTMATTASPPFISSSLNSTCTSFRTSLPTCSFSPKLLPRRPLASFSVKASRKQVEVGKRFCCYDLKNLITVLVGSHNSSWFEPDVVR